MSDLIEANRGVTDYMKLSQDATNEIWSVILRREYPTPGAMKRAIEREIRAALELALGVPQTTAGFEDGLDAMGTHPAPVPKPNPYAIGVERKDSHRPISSNHRSYNEGWNACLDAILLSTKQ